MAETITLELPEALVIQAKDVATRTQRRLEDVLLEWLDRAAAETPLESLSDSQILSLCELQMAADQQEEMSRLLALNRENQLSPSEQQRLEELMQLYRRDLVRKAHALQIAVQRGLKPPLQPS
ncbi:MAG: hypothetical protein H6631_11400 [Anaerolineaceae bacterium]|nr:hypothetical protein [Anaerolineaceae bacterium]MCB9102242.1 hypothetical protein [Anaerolineales bacterium]